MRVPILLLAALAVGCGPSEAPPAPPPDASLALADTASGPLAAPLPVVELRDGVSDTLALDALLGSDLEAAFPPSDDAEVDTLDGRRVVIRAAEDAPRPVLVPLTVGGVGYVLVTRDTAAPPPALRLTVEGVDPADPSLLVVTATAADGADVMLDDEDGLALVDDRLVEENALDIHADRLVLDLDALGPGRRRLRLVATPPGGASDWAEVEIADGRLVE